jgi:hypothetical protein
MRRKGRATPASPGDVSLLRTRIFAVSVLVLAIAVLDILGAAASWWDRSAAVRFLRLLPARIGGRFSLGALWEVVQFAEPPEPARQRMSARARAPDWVDEQWIRRLPRGTEEAALSLVDDAADALFAERLAIDCELERGNGAPMVEDACRKLKLLNKGE